MKEYYNLEMMKNFSYLLIVGKRQLVLLFLVVVVSMLADAQVKGIQFVEGLNWEQVKEKAKATNKYIFVDCYATWCGPCKKMDREVYSNETVGSLVNSNFVSIKVQMDSTKKDSENVRMFYAAARQFERDHNVTGLPTFLFFSPDGEIVHKSMGQRNAIDFSSLVAEAIKPEKQLYKIISDWRLGKIPYCNGKELIQKLKQESISSEIVLEIARDYMHYCLDQLDDDSFCSKENQIFMAQNRRMFSVKDRVFKLYLYQPEKIDEILLGKGFAKHVVSATIVKDEIFPLANAANDAGRRISWRTIERKIGNKYAQDITVVSMIEARVGWYKKKQEWVPYSEWLVKQIEQSDLENISHLYLNGCAWDIFKYSNNRREIRAALKWLDICLKKDSNDVEFIDTRACLLYKLGRRDEAIALEETVLTKNAIPKNRDRYQFRLDMMKGGEDIWVIFDN